MKKNKNNNKRKNYRTKENFKKCKNNNLKNIVINIEVSSHIAYIRSV